MERCVWVLLCGWLAACGGTVAGTGATASKRRAPDDEQVRGPLLWKISKAGKVSHLLVMPPPGVRIEELPPLVWQTMAKSHLVALQHDPTTIDAKALKRLAILPEGKSLGDMLGVKDTNTLHRELGVTGGDVADVEAIDRLRPGAAATFVTSSWVMEEESYARFAVRAKKTKPVMVLVGSYVEEMKKLLAAYQLGYLRLILSEVPVWRDRVQQAMTSYRAGDIGPLRRMANTAARGVDKPDVVRAWNAQGGTVWIDRIAPELARGGLFIAIGADEALNDKGMLRGLRARGYRVERLGAGTPPTLAKEAPVRSGPATCRAAMKRVARASEAQPNSGAERALVAFCLEKLSPAVVTCFGDAAAVKDIKACGEHSGRILELASSGRQEVAEARKLAARACACSDLACSKAVLADFKTFMIANKDKRIRKKQAQRAGEAVKEMTKCLIEKGVPPKEIMETMMEIRRQ